MSEIKKEKNKTKHIKNKRTMASLDVRPWLKIGKKFMELFVGLASLFVAIVGIFVAREGNRLSEMQRIALEYENKPKFELNEKMSIEYMPIYVDERTKILVKDENGESYESASTVQKYALRASSSLNSFEELEIICRSGIAENITTEIEEYIFFRISTTADNGESVSYQGYVPIHERLSRIKKHLYIADDIPSLSAVAQMIDVYGDYRINNSGQSIYTSMTTRPMQIYRITYTNCFGQKQSELFYSPDKKYEPEATIYISDENGKIFFDVEHDIGWSRDELPQFYQQNSDLILCDDKMDIYHEYTIAFSPEVGKEPTDQIEEVAQKIKSSFSFNSKLSTSHSE